jgi:hypothetical protein
LSVTDQRAHTAGVLTTSRHVTSRHVTTQHAAPAQSDHSRCTARYTSGPNLLPFKCAFTCKCAIKYSFVIRITIIITSCAPLHMISVSLVQGSDGLLYHVLFTLCSIRVTICTTCLSIKIFAFCFRVILTISSDFSSHSMNQVVFVKQKRCVYCEVENKILCKSAGTSDSTVSNCGSDRELSCGCQKAAQCPALA